MTTIQGTTKLAGVMGWPVKHTLSPPMQNAAIEKLGLDWVYLPLEVPIENLREALEGVRAMGFAGVNLTIPHKIEAVGMIDWVDPEAAAIGAVNTVHILDGQLRGYNTDATGYVRTVEIEGDFAFKGATILQIGSGGVGRAMAAGAASAGASEVMLYDISAERSAELAETMGKTFSNCTFTVLSDAEALATAAVRAGLIANATPLGMHEGDPLPIAPEALSASHTVFDAVYVPAMTDLLKAAETAGAKPVRGLGMLARQGARSLEIWSGAKPDENLMISVLKGKLGLE